MKKLLALLCALTLLAGMTALPAVAETVPDVTTLYKNKDIDATYTAEECVTVTLQGTTADFPADAGITLENGVLSITAKGDYLLSGSFEGRIEVTADKEKDVRLILNGVTVTSAEGPALLVRSADKVILTLAEGTVNTLSDATAPVETDDTYDAALYSCDDLSINGTGTLNVSGSVKNGVTCKNDLIIADGLLNVTAVNDGLRGKDSVTVLGGTLNVTCDGDAIVSVDTEEGHGVVTIAGGTMNLTTGGGAGQAQTVSANDWGRGGFGFGGTSVDTEDSLSSKGLKAAASLYVLGGTINANTLDDALHAADVTVAGGVLALASGDDGIHADNALTISGGTINITQSYEGLEGTDILISGGDISLVASDDGVNGAGGNDSSGMSGWGGGRDSFSSGTATVTITGGVLRVNAEGDGLDSNGSLTVSGGETYVDGPTNSGNGALDYDSACTVTGGVLVATGSGGMAQGVSDAQGQAAMMIYADGNANQTVTVLDSTGTVIASWTPTKAWSSLVVTAPAIVSGSSYTVTVDGNAVYTGTPEDASSSGMGSMGNWGGRDGMGGGHGGKQR